MGNQRDPHLKVSKGGCQEDQQHDCQEKEAQSENQQGNDRVSHLNNVLQELLTHFGPRQEDNQ